MLLQMSEQPNNEEKPFIELNRRFRKLEQKTKAEESALESYTSYFRGWQNGFGWDDLLKENRVVILGEPGSGKSWELIEHAKLLSRQGAFAFFIRLDQLVERDLRSLWDANEQHRFARWKQSNEAAYFFLDSVDEAKFRKVSDFHATLERFRNEVGSDSLLRAKLFLSSRISEWQPYSDGFEFRRLFPLPPAQIRTGDDESKTDEPQEVPLVVHLEPLDRDKVETFARAKGISDSQLFLEALDRAYAWEFARRPLDVSELIGFWKAKGRIGSLSELIEFDISSKLRPRANRDEHPLSDAKGREGSEWLGAASAMSRKFSFSVLEDGSVDEDALNPLACLPANWRADEARALLNRAIFDGAVYGRLRFHHRRVGEYLAARWIADRMDKGCPQHELEGILVEIVRGQKVLRPALRSIAAWLCFGNETWNELVRSLVLETDPWLHLKYGDPANLSITYRRQVLAALASLSKNRKRMWIESSPDCLARIADSGLSADISELISNRELSTDFRVELLDIVRHGRLAACVAEAIKVISSPDEEEMLKSHAASAIGAMSEPGNHRQLFQTVDKLSVIPNRLCRSVIEALYPKTISSVELAQLLAKTESVREFSVDLPFYLKSHFESVLIPEDAGSLLKQLLVLAQTPPLVLEGQKIIPVSEQFYWIGKIIPTALDILFRKPILSSDEIDISAEALQLLGHIRGCHYRELNDDEVGKLNESTMRHPRVRQGYVWRVASAFRAEHMKEATMSLELFDHWEVLRLSPKDFSWLIHDIQKRGDSNERLLALRLAIEVWDISGRNFSNRWNLRRATQHDAILRRAYRQSVMTSPFFSLKRFWWRKVRYQYDKWWWKRKFDLIRTRWQWLRGQFVLLRNLRKLESGKRMDWLQRLSHEADEKNSSHWTTTSWSDLEKKRGKRITRATKRGCMAAWRSYAPPLPHEKPEAHRTTIGVLVGLTGLQVEFQDNPVAISKLTEEEAELAARYAMDELNGFPNWLESLAIAHPKAVAKVLCECVEAEWKIAKDCKDTNEVLADLAWHGEALIHLVREKLLSLLNVSDPQNFTILRFVLFILMRQPNPPVQYMAELASHRTTAANELSVMVLWLVIWMQIDGEAALKGLLGLLPNSSNSGEFIVRLCSVLSGEDMERGPFVKNPSYLRPACLRQFIPIVYHHVKFSEDINRSDGGSYSPTARDHAQRFRGILLDCLAKDEALEATDFLRELADEPSMSEVRDWILKLLDQRLEKEADFEPWTPADIRNFAEEHEIEPKNDKELFCIARKRLQVLKWNVEQSDNSLRDELRKDDTEIKLRQWLQRKLLERSQKRYTIPQEAEIDLQERPDLRLENPRTNPVSIEIKWADSWTLSQLLERLENQLIGQYLRAHNSRFGIFFLGFIHKKQHWEEPGTGKKLTFSEVVEIVKGRAIALTQQNPKICGLEVVSIDFSQPE